MTQYKERESLSVVLESEKQRVTLRDEQLLALELEWVTKQPRLDTVSFNDLDAYCRWLSPTQSKVVKWDLLRHCAVQKDLPYFPEYQRNQGVVCKPYRKDYKNRLEYVFPADKWYLKVMHLME